MRPGNFTTNFFSVHDHLISVDEWSISDCYAIDKIGAKMFVNKCSGLLFNDKFDKKSWL